MKEPGTVMVGLSMGWETQSGMMLSLCLLLIWEILLNHIKTIFFYSVKETFPHLILQKSNIVKVSTDSTGIIFSHAPTQFFLYNSFQKLVNIPLRFLLITIRMLYYFFCATSTNNFHFGYT